MSKLKEWWEKTKWSWRRINMNVPIHKWEVEKYLRNNNISHLEFYGKIIAEIRKPKQR
jgi:hypothetical protein